MSKSFLFNSLAAILLALVSSMAAPAQQLGSVPYKTQELSEKDGVPVIMEHLPNWEGVRKQAVFARSTGELKAALGERPILDLIDFTAGTEAVSAPYPEGRLLIVEFASPQGSIDADNKILAELSSSGSDTTAYRRIGNYNVLVFDATDKAAANALIDQVKYEKQIQWLGNNPFHISAERAFVLTTSDIFVSTVIVIVMGVGISLVGGLLAGFFYFLLRDRRRAARGIYTDAGGMTRLNLDGFTPDILPDRLLKD